MINIRKVMGNTNFKERTLEEWGEPCNKFINKYLSRKQSITGMTSIEVWLAEYPQLKNNLALKYINTLDTSLQDGIFILATMGPNLTPLNVTFKEEQVLKMLEILYERQFISFVDGIYKKNVVSLNVNSMAVHYDSKNIKIVIDINGFPSYLVFDINDV
jgi:hypothetical protein